MAEVKTVLLVDDDDDVRTVGAMSLEHVGGFVVTTAPSGQAGLDSARLQAPDVILLDMMMPGLDGMGVLAELRADPTTERIPVVFVTAKAQARDVPRYLEAGAIGVIEKPFDPLTLPDEVRDLVARRVVGDAAK